MRALRAGGVIAMQATVAKNPSAMTKGAVSVGGSRPKWSIEMFPGEATVKKTVASARFRSDFSTDRLKNAPSVPRNVPQCAQNENPPPVQRACGCI